MLSDGECQVVERANNVKYGLCATVWSADINRAHRVARKLEVCIETNRLTDVPLYTNHGLSGNFTFVTNVKFPDNPDFLWRSSPRRSINNEIIKPCLRLSTARG